MVFFSVGITFRVHPSNIVEVNEVVTLQCALDPNPTPPVVVFFSYDFGKILCSLEPYNGVCKNASSSCVTRYNGSCSNETVFSMQVNVSWTWNGKSLSCNSLYSNSNTINLTVTVPVTSVTLTLNSTTVIAGQQINLTCTTSYCNPPADITWYKSSTDITSQSTYTRVALNGSVKTTSQLLNRVVKTDNGQDVFCTASNTPSLSVKSMVYTLTVLYKPEVISTTSSPYRIIEGHTAALECRVTAANPNSRITWAWYKIDNPGTVLHNGSKFTVPNIKRKMSGSYSCTASNSVGTSEAVDINIDIQYKPEVRSSASSPYRVIEGQTAVLGSTVTDANPNTSILWKWFKTDNLTDVLYNGSRFVIQNIMRDRSGSYSCTASNSVGTSEAVDAYLDVQYKPEIIHKPSTLVNENEKVILTRTIDSNPSADVLWYSGKLLLLSQLSVKNATFTIEKASCTDTTNFTLVASNKVQRNVTALVELIVNCKPMVDNKKINLGVTGNTGLNFSIMVIAYPEPQYELEYENGTRNDEFIESITKHAVNYYTINFHHKTLRECDYGTYHLMIRNSYGLSTVKVNIFKQRKPDNPRNIRVTCEGTRATVQWISSFNGGDRQTFNVFALNGHQGGNRSIQIPDMGENKTHRAYVQNLQPSMTYVFYVSAQNNHGFSISDIISCITSKEISHSQTGAIAGGVAGTLVLIMIVVVTVFLVHKRYTYHITFKKRKSEEVNEADKDTSPYSNLTEQQQGNVEKNMYDELKGNESARNYEAVLMKENFIKNCKRPNLMVMMAKEIHSNEPMKPLQSSMDNFTMMKATEE
uniref:Uncharacterized protein n=1 Tax=Magallana gigas TaxID=29159 RepID=A0A8W8NKS0_MAGGI